MWLQGPRLPHPSRLFTPAASRVPTLTMPLTHACPGCRSRRVVQGQRALVVLLVDLLDASGSILGRVRDLVGAPSLLSSSSALAGCLPPWHGCWRRHAALTPHARAVQLAFPSPHLSAVPTPLLQETTPSCSSAPRSTCCRPAPTPPPSPSGWRRPQRSSASMPCQRTWCARGACCGRLAGWLGDYGCWMQGQPNGRPGCLPAPSPLPGTSPGHEGRTPTHHHPCLPPPPPAGVVQERAGRAGGGGCHPARAAGAGRVRDGGRQRRQVGLHPRPRAVRSPPAGQGLEAGWAGLGGRLLISARTLLETTVALPGQAAEARPPGPAPLPFSNLKPLNLNVPADLYPRSDMASMGSRQYDPLALSRGRFLPVESAMPGTTLELIPMEARFKLGGAAGALIWGRLGWP